MGSRPNLPRAARFPASSLEALADLRREPGIAVILDGERTWVLWEDGDERIAHRVMAIPEVDLFEERGGEWFPLGGRLPAFGTPLDSERAVPLVRALSPQPVRPLGADEPAPSPVRLGLRRDDRPRAASAIRCRRSDLEAWADWATSAALRAVSVARAGDEVLVRGHPLPPIASAERFWGDRLLCPLGFRPDPGLPEPAILRALGVEDGDLLVIEADGCEIVAMEGFGPVSRAAIRRSGAEAAP